MRDYAKYRFLMDELKEQDYKDSFDWDERRNHKLSLEEKLVDGAMTQERQTIIGSKHIYKEYLPTSMFYDVIPLIDKTISYEILRQLPKGGNLHIHSSSTWDAVEFVDYLAAQHGEHIYIQADEARANYGTMRYWLKKESIGQGYLSLNEYLKNHSKKEIVGLITFNQGNMQETDDAWETFDTIFSRVSSIICVEPIYKHYYEQAFLTSYKDNVKYLELRMGIGSLVQSNDEENQKNGTTPEQTLHILYKVYQDFKKQHQDFQCKLIISTSRSKSKPAEVLQLMKQAQAWKSQVKDGEEDFIVGFDFVSEEDVNFKTDYYAEVICKNDISLDFYFHDGESNWADDDNIMSAVALGTVRLGHGLNLYRFPELMERVKEKKICLEMCPVSNQLLRYTQDLRVHPLGEYMKRGVPVVICSDDPQIFGNKGLTYDFWEVYFGQLADMYMVKQAIVNSYQYSALPKAAKATYITKWRTEWQTLTTEIAHSDLLYCAIMFEGYYDRVKAEGTGNSKVYTLNAEEMNLWTNVYYKMVCDTKDYHIEDFEFFSRSDKTLGVGTNGSFRKVEYCNFMYQIYKYLYQRRQSGRKSMKRRSKADDVKFVKDCIALLESYVPDFRYEARFDLHTHKLNKEDKEKWDKYYKINTQYNLIPDGSFFGNAYENVNYGIGADGSFYARELLHFLYQCYKFLFFNYIYEK
jgi:adenosine deaminase CECR1